MKNNSLKYIVIGIVAFGLIFGASSVKAQTINEDYIKTLQSLIRVLMQMVVQLQQQLAQGTPTPTITTTTTTVPSSTTCTDSDGGDNLYVAGFITGNYYPTLHSEVLSHGTGIGSTKSFADYCENSNILKEFYCVSPSISVALGSGHEIVDVSYSCPSGYTCQDGACQLTSLRINLTIDPSSIYEDQSTTIIWSASPINSISYCRASGGSGDWFGIKAASGREIIHPVRNNYQDYVLSCFDKYGQSISESDGVAFLSTTTTKPPISTTTSATTWYTYKRCTDGRCVNHTTSVGSSADQCSTHADCTTTTTTTSATTWYTYKRCTDGRCVNHTTWVGPSADQCSTHADCI